MKFDPATQRLFTDAGELIKVLHCPLRMRWEQLAARDGSPHRTCAECGHQVLDTAVMTDAEALARVRAEPSACLCVSANQKNVTLVTTSVTPYQGGFLNPLTPTR